MCIFMCKCVFYSVRKVLCFMVSDNKNFEIKSKINTHIYVSCLKSNLELQDG